MSIKIGNNNKIIKSNISEKTSVLTDVRNKSFFSKHPIISTILISLLVGFALMFSFWDNIVIFIEQIF